MSESGHRVFVAVELDPALREAVLDLEARLEAAGARVRWVKPENLHFTLRFLGHISDAQLNRVRIAARGAGAGVPPFRMVLAGLGAFPSLRRPQVVWVGTREGEEGLKSLAALLDDHLARQRFPKEPRDFRAHLTLARVKEGRLWPDVARAVGQFADAEVGSQQVDRLVVMESLLRPQGAIYTPVEEVRLSPYEK